MFRVRTRTTCPQTLTNAAEHNIVVQDDAATRANCCRTATRSEHVLEPRFAERLAEAVVAVVKFVEQTVGEGPDLHAVLILQQPHGEVRGPFAREGEMARRSAFEGVHPYADAESQLCTYLVVR